MSARRCASSRWASTAEGTKQPLALGRGLDGERARGHRPTDTAARPWAGCDPAAPGGHRRSEGTAHGRDRRLRLTVDPALSTAQDPYRTGPFPGSLQLSVHARL